jgi:hypothetical protein
VSFPILIENREALGELHGESVRVSSLRATSLILTCRGVDEILIANAMRDGSSASGARLAGVTSRTPVGCATRGPERRNPPSGAAVPASSGGFRSGLAGARLCGIPLEIRVSRSAWSALQIRNRNGCGNRARIGLEGFQVQTLGSPQ